MAAVGESAGSTEPVEHCLAEALLADPGLAQSDTVAAGNPLFFARFIPCEYALCFVRFLVGTGQTQEPVKQQVMGVAMTEAQRLIRDDPVADLNARISIIGQRQEELAQVVGKLDHSAGDFGQLRAYVEQIAGILADLAKEVEAHDLTMLELRLDKLAEAAGEVGKLRTEVSKLQDEVHDVAEPAGEVAERPETNGVVWWPDLPTGHERAEALQSLGRWVDEVLRARHPEAYNELGTCWFWHPDILDELTALQAAWLAAYRDTASPGTAAIEWHDRWLPGSIARCSAAIRARGCKGRHEKESHPTATFLDRQEFKNFARCGPEPLAPVTEPSPPWDPATEPSPRQAGRLELNNPLR